MNKLIVGIDVSKDTLDFCILQQKDHSVIERGVIKNNKKAISSWVEKYDPDSIVVSMEHTGH